uniref:Receptor ligand binding region domain-containing protein n=1 Tax=Timema genevievae TaxID=629358 RepID=A0A7R9PIQ8_TIMGE|nr:unnamed protein product [Timema genevievae]
MMKKFAHTYLERKSGKPFWKKHLQYTRPRSSHDLPVIGSLVYCESDALDHTATKAASRLLRRRSSTKSFFACLDVGVLAVSISELLLRLYPPLSGECSQALSGEFDPLQWLHGLRHYSRNRLAVNVRDIGVRARSGVLRVELTKMNCHLHLLLVSLLTSSSCGASKRIYLNYTGDIMVGALFPIHRKGSNGTECGRIQMEDGVQPLEAMIFTLNQINNDPKILPGIKLGMLAFDSCDSQSYGLEQSLNFVKDAAEHTGERAVRASKLGRAVRCAGLRTDRSCQVVRLCLSAGSSHFGAV